MMITDFGDMEEAKEWIDKIETEAKQTEKTLSSPDFQYWVLLRSTWSPLFIQLKRLSLNALK